MRHTARLFLRAGVFCSGILRSYGSPRAVSVFASLLLAVFCRLAAVAGINGAPPVFYSVFKTVFFRFISAAIPDTEKQENRTYNKRGSAGNGKYGA